MTQVCNLIAIPGWSETFTGLAQDSECVKVVVPVVNWESREQITGGGMFQAPASEAHAGRMDFCQWTRSLGPLLRTSLAVRGPVPLR